MMRSTWRRIQDNTEDQGLVVVAIDTDKGSQHALRWAADHLISKGQIFVLLHVRKPPTIPTTTGKQVPLSEVNEEVASTFLQQFDLQTKEVFLPFQCYCNRRGLQCKEVIIDDTDVPKAIVDYVVEEYVDKLVLGASSRNVLTSFFKGTDVSTAVSKAAPDFCSIYIISKGRISSVRPASHPNTTKRRPARKFESSGNFQSTKSDPNAASLQVKSDVQRIGRGQEGEFSTRSYDGNMHKRINPEFLYPSTASCPNPGRTGIDQHLNYYQQDYVDVGVQKSHFSNLHQDPNAHIRSLDLSTFRKQKLSGGLNLHELSHQSTESYCSAESLEGEEAELGRLKHEFHPMMGVHNKAKDLDSWMAGKKGIGENFAEEMAGNEKERFKLAQGEDQAAQMEKMKVCDASPDFQYKRYTIVEIQKATNNFSDNLKIGEGGYGPVFKSTLDHTLVAIKILRSDADQGMKQFQQEVEVLSCIRHPNMVMLLGACPEYGCLIYEYMANGSLEDRLFCRNNTPPLTWQLRFKIAADIATGLLYLHQMKPEPLVHRDLKPANILLDTNFNSKIADVGLARLLPPSVAEAITQYRMTAAAGTFCYIDPEYQKTGLLGMKSDVYALGIILLQLITAQPPMGLAYNMEEAMDAGELEEMLDPRVNDWPMKETVEFAKLALKCCELRRKDRPDLGNVVLPVLNQLRDFACQSLPNLFL